MVENMPQVHQTSRRVNFIPIQPRQIIPPWEFYLEGGVTV